MAKESHKQRRPFTNREKRRIWALYRKGLSYVQIALGVGRNHSSIGDLIRRMDLEEERQLVAIEEEEDAHAGR